MKLPAKAAIRRLHMRIYAHRAIQFAHLKVRLANNIAAPSLLDDRRKRDLLDGIREYARRRPPVPRIDWPDARRGDPAADLCRSYLLMKLYAAEIATTYRARTAEQPIYRVRPCLAGCRTWQLPGLPKMFQASSMTC